MILIEAVAAAVGFLLKGIAFLFLITAAGLAFIILREAAWYVRQQNKEKMEDKDNADSSI